MAGELGLIERWIYATLSADSTLMNMLPTQPAEIGGVKIFNGIANQKAIFPLVIFRWVSPIRDGDTYVNGARRTWTRQRYEIVVVDQRANYSTTMQDIDARIDTLLSISNTVAVSGGNILQCIRETPYKRASVEVTLPFRELGGSYDIMAQSV